MKIMLKVYFFNSFKFIKIFNFIYKFATKDKNSAIKTTLEYNK